MGPVIFPNWTTEAINNIVSFHLGLQEVGGGDCGSGPVDRKKTCKDSITQRAGVMVMIQTLIVEIRGLNPGCEY